MTEHWTSSSKAGSLCNRLQIFATRTRALAQRAARSRPRARFEQKALATFQSSRREHRRTMKTEISFVAAVLVGLATGCVTHTTIKDAPRQSVTFGSPEAAQHFYDAYLAASSPKGHGSVVMYVPLPYWHRTVRRDNVRFNAAVEAADANRDGIISDEEASAFTGNSQCNVAPLPAFASNVRPQAKSGKLDRFD